MRFADCALEGSLPSHSSHKVQMAGALPECLCSLGSGERVGSVTFISAGQPSPPPGLRAAASTKQRCCFPTTSGGKGRFLCFFFKLEIKSWGWRAGSQGIVLRAWLEVGARSPGWFCPCVPGSVLHPPPGRDTAGSRDPIGTLRGISAAFSTIFQNTSRYHVGLLTCWASRALSIPVALSRPPGEEDFRSET